MIYVAFSRHLLKHPWQLSLAILGVTVGISVIVAIRLAQHSAYASFEQATTLNTAGATHQIRSRAGNWLSQQQFIDFRQ